MNYFVTTSIPYVNGDPHIGFGMELVAADVLARYARLQGDQVLFSTGTDEHGQKVEEKAAELGLKPEVMASQMADKFKDLQKLLNVSNDRFIRTTDPGHEKRVQYIWKAIEKDIYKAPYTGWYDVVQEEFVSESKADPARLKPDHPKAYKRVEEENYFFRLSKYTAQIRQAIEENAFLIVPKTRRNEILGVLKEGLDDISVSRPRDKVGWGIPVPGDPSQNIYVWFEALMNYITVLGYPEHTDFMQFWPASVQVIGKDIIRFHAAIWPAILLSLGLPLPKMLYVHGFVNVDGQKISKSIGNVISPQDIVKKYGADAFRYYFMRHIPAYEDGDFSWEMFAEAYNNELANELGNAVQRTVAMIQRYQEGVIGALPSAKHDTALYHAALAVCNFDKALGEVWNQVRGLNQYIDEEKPWEIAKSDDFAHLQEVLAYQAGCLLEIADLLEPFLPSTAAKIRSVFEKEIIYPLESTLFPKDDAKVANA